MSTDTLVTEAAEMSLACYEAGRLPDFIAEMSVRIDLAGGGDLLDEWARKRVKRQRIRRRWYARNRAR